MTKRRAPAPTIREFITYAEHGDDISRVLRCHLALETLLNAILDPLSPDGSEIDRLPFMAKFDVCVMLGRLPAEYRPAWAKANKLRNAVAHDLAATVTDELARELVGSLPETAVSATVRATPNLHENPPMFRVATAFGLIFLDATRISGLEPDALNSLILADGQDGEIPLISDETGVFLEPD